MKTVIAMAKNRFLRFFILSICLPHIYERVQFQMVQMISNMFFNASHRNFTSSNRQCSKCELSSKVRHFLSVSNLLSFFTYHFTGFLEAFWNLYLVEHVV